ncbi:unnamed protein product [Phaeothamnion confervicola]
MAPARVEPGCFIRTVRLLELLCALVALSQVIAQIVIIVLGSISITQYAIRGYIVLLAAGAVLVELGLGSFVKGFLISTNWIARGLYYIFIGLLTLEQSDVGSATAQDYIEVTAYAMMGFGALYAFMGLVCLQRVYTAKVERYEARRLHSSLATENESLSAGLTKNDHGSSV